MNDDNKHNLTGDNDESGETSLVGDTPDLESDDDTLENTHSMGLYPNADDEHPAELNLAGEVEKAEKQQ